MDETHKKGNRPKREERKKSGYYIRELASPRTNLAYSAWIRLKAVLTPIYSLMYSTVKFSSPLLGVPGLITSIRSVRPVVPDLARDFWYHGAGAVRIEGILCCNSSCCFFFRLGIRSVRYRNQKCCRQGIF
jgi:hypothetical protein